jgi:CheY-like chemotaxis protein
MPAVRVLTAISDLFFAAKVDATLRPLGYEPVKTSSVDDIVAALAEGARGCLVLDLDHRALDAMQVIEQLRREVDPPVKILAYTNHSNVDGIRRALALGADKVVARSELAAHLPQLIATLTA